jgi:DNA-binding transcriptional MerR regulator
MAAMPIRDAAAASGFSAHTLRYYERAGLLPAVAREPGSRHRSFTERDLAWLSFLERLRATGMSIRQMRRFAALRQDGEATVAERRAMLEEHLDGVRRRIAHLESAADAIERKVEVYRRLEADCPEARREEAGG